ncbi:MULTISPECIES: hypothetical protein [unclassified Streptomyces]|uniref:hypothetical protein n=1 Tax=unclassified Streptomyces TaxID=2593676 RepID=UPI0024A90033|nr:MULTISPECIES: hypothetical protein [unclassified Streptomyces]
MAVAEACEVDPVRDLGLGVPHFPEPSVVGAEAGADGAMRLLRQRCESGVAARGLDRDRRSMDQLDYELGVIDRLHYEPYFLAVAQVVTDVRDMGIRVAARGSGAGSMVNHSLFVAMANPLEHHLLFERFLSERRSSLPDIDIDVESARRLEVYDRIIDRFGRKRVSVTGMPQTYRTRHALRDTSLALGIAPATVDGSRSRSRTSGPATSAPPSPSRRSCGTSRQRPGGTGRCGRSLAESLDALPRGIAMHPCGVVLSNTSLLDRLPVQADTDDVEDLGLLKLDVLGVRMQSAAAHAVTKSAPPPARQSTSTTGSRSPSSRPRTRWGCSSWSPPASRIWSAASSP